jgi:hypothetical protein
MSGRNAERLQFSENIALIHRRAIARPVTEFNHSRPLILAKTPRSTVPEMLPAAVFTIAPFMSCPFPAGEPG